MSAPMQQERDALPPPDHNGQPEPTPTQDEDVSAIGGLGNVAAICVAKGLHVEAAIIRSAVKEIDRLRPPAERVPAGSTVFESAVAHAGRLTLEAALADAAGARAARAHLMPDERAAIQMMQTVWSRLKDLGWRDIVYCPKDGSPFDSISAGVTAVHRCRYQGTWPTGSWWVEDAGDLWPARPILFRAGDLSTTKSNPNAPDDSSGGTSDE